jgi:hypothetical protein
MKSRQAEKACQIVIMDELAAGNVVFYKFRRCFTGMFFKTVVKRRLTIESYFRSKSEK